MKTRRDGNGLWVVLLERGDKVRESVEGFAAQVGLGGARISAIGALENPELAVYDLPQKKYYSRTFEGIFELLTADGNITLKDGRPFMHMHVAIGDHEYRVHGGHLKDAVVGVVVEMFMEPLAEPLSREMDEDIGLPSWAP
jgi:predicted DNA-binding protein with PD1-like motif